MTSRRRLDVFNHHERSHKQNLEHTAQLTALNTAQTATNSKLDVLSGAINNNIGDGSVKLQTYVYGHDSGNGLARPLAVTANGELKVSNDVLEVSAETVNLNTDTLEAKTQAVTDKLDTFAGAGNNNIGEGSSKLQTYLYARNIAAGHFKPVVCNSSAQLEVAVASTALPTGAATEATLAAAEVHLGSIDTSATAMDIGIGGLRSDLTQNGLGGGNKPGVMLEAQNTNLIAISNKMVGGQTTSGMATAANQQVVDLTLQGIDTVLGDTQTIHSATNTKLDTLITSNAAIKTAVEILDNVVSGSEAQVVVVSLPALPTGTNTIGTVNLSATDNAVLDAIATDAAAIEVLLTAANTDHAANEALLTTIDADTNDIKTNTAACATDLAAIEVLLTAANTDHAANEALLTTIDADTNDIKTNTAACATDLAAIEVLLTAANTDHAANEVLLTTIDADTNDIKTNTAACATDLAALEVLQTATNSLLTDLDAVQDNALTKLTNIETAVQLIDDVVKAEDAAHSGADKGIMGLSVRKDTATNLAGSDADYQPLITGSAGHLHMNDSLRHRVKDVAWMSNEAISATSYGSTVLDTEGFQNICIYGEMNSGSVSGNSLMIEGSNSNSGTFYGLGYLTNTTYGGVGGRTQFLDHSTSNGFGGRIYPRYLKIFNKTSGTINATLRATLAGFNTYI